jgi:hypothetical protein
VKFQIDWCVRFSVKSKQVPLHAVEARGGERMYSSYSFTTLALDGGEWSASRLGRALAPGQGPPVPIVQETGCLDTEATGKILSPLPGIEPLSPGCRVRSHALY